MLPARARGYRRLWFVGISLGGLGALTLAQEHPDAAAGLLAIAPYLGEPDLVREIEAAGGARALDGRGPRSRISAACGAGCAATRRRQPRPPLWLAYGESDRYAYGHRLLASALPRDRCWSGPAATTGRPGIASGASSSPAARSRARSPRRLPRVH